MRSQGGLPAVLTTLCISLVLISLASPALIGCTGQSSSASTTSAVTSTSTTVPLSTTSTEVETTTTTATRLAWGVTGTWQDVSVTVSDARVDPSPESVDPGNKVLYCLVKIANNSQEAFDYNGLDFILLDTAGQAYDSFGLTSLTDLGEGTLAPGGSVNGAVAFEVPEDTTPSELQWQPESESQPVLVWGGV